MGEVKCIQNISHKTVRPGRKSFIHFLFVPNLKYRVPFRCFCDLTYIRHSRTPLDERSACRRGPFLYKTTQHKRQTSMPRTGLEPASPATKWPQTYVFYRAATGIGTGRKGEDYVTIRRLLSMIRCMTLLLLSSGFICGRC
jgi:hypothetical protein